MKNIYVVLTQTGTLFSRVIRKITRDPYNHSSLSFDKHLSVMYSFGRKRRYNVLNNGFIEENFQKGLFVFFPNTKCCILEVTVEDSEYEAMLAAVHAFQNQQEQYRYNLIGVLVFAAGIRFQRKNHFFCSQFVSHILQHSRFWRYPPELTKPMDFLAIDQKRILFEGNMRDYIKAYLQPSALSF